MIVLGVVAAACSTGTAGTATSEAVTSTTTATTVQAPAIAVAAPATTVSPGNESATADDDEAFTETTDLVYMKTDTFDFSMDVRTPASGEGPWPVVVAFHGFDDKLKDEMATTVVADEAAAQGMVVFTPSWVDFAALPITVDTFEAWKETANCAIAFAQQSAASYGGDPAATVLYGFSAGVGPALFGSLEPIDAPIEGCATDAPPTPPVGVVLGDGEYLLHSQNFDEAFAADPEAMQAEVAAMTDPSYWPPNLDARFFLWIASDGTNPRIIDNASDVPGWLALRDPSGSIRADLEQLGQLDDGVVSYIDAGQLLAQRLSEAGIDVTLDEYPGGHTTLDKVFELVGYLHQAVGG
ncbi:MAG: hypothetical protein WBV06_07855 [Acidimicrobiia bacterium]